MSSLKTVENCFSDLKSYVRIINNHLRLYYYLLSKSGEHILALHVDFFVGHSTVSYLDFLLIFGQTSGSDFNSQKCCIY